MKQLFQNVLIVALFCLSGSVLAQYHTIVNIGDGAGSTTGGDSLGVVLDTGQIVHANGVNNEPIGTDSLLWKGGLQVVGPVQLTGLVAGLPDSALFVDEEGKVGKMEILSMAYESNILASDVTVGTGFVTGPSITLDAGTWLVMSSVTVEVESDGSTRTFLRNRLWDGSAPIAGGRTTVVAGSEWGDAFPIESIHLSTIITVFSSTTISSQVQLVGTTVGSIKSSITNASKTSQINAIRLQ